LVQLYAFSASDSTGAAFKGDLVVADGSHNGTELTDAYAPGIPCVSPVVAAHTTNVFRGVIAGFVPQPEYNMSVTASLGTMYRLDDTARYVWVVDDYFTVFEAQQVLNGWTTGTANMINASADIDYTTGNTTTGISGVQVAAASTGELPLRILRLNQRVDNFLSTASDTSAYFKLDVMIQNSDLAQASLGVGA
jgi:hypothetical protein